MGFGLKWNVIFIVQTKVRKNKFGFCWIWKVRKSEKMKFDFYWIWKIRKSENPKVRKSESPYRPYRPVHTPKGEYSLSLSCLCGVCTVCTDFRTFGLSDFRIFGFFIFNKNQISFFRTFGLSDFSYSIKTKFIFRTFVCTIKITFHFKPKPIIFLRVILSKIILWVCTIKITFHFKPKTHNLPKTLFRDVPTLKNISLTEIFFKITHKIFWTKWVHIEI